MSSYEEVPIIIPAYNPQENLLTIVDSLTKLGTNEIIIVDDGSKMQTKFIFDELRKIKRCTILTHAINMGKGRALKTAFNYCLTNFSHLKGVVTADADGQHACKDIIRVAKKCAEARSRDIVIGVRSFSKDIPFRSKFGNLITRQIFHLATGVKLSDTQTGLRGISSTLLPKILCLKGEQYEYEMNMLLSSSRMDIVVSELPIETRYEDGNKSSHFNPILDSFKIYFLILRFASSSLITFSIDFICFLSLYRLFSNFFYAALGARIVASSFNFMLNKKFVFKSRDKFVSELLKYYILILSMSFISSSIMFFFYNFITINIIVIKIFSELILFPFNFGVQNFFIFRKNR